MNTGWPDNFPDVMHFVDLQNVCAKPWRLIADHPDYIAAKTGEDRDAAMRLIKDVIKTPENRKQLLELKNKFPGAIIVPVRAIEAQGKNRIPEMCAEYIAQQTGLNLDSRIVQSNKVHRTGSDPWHRFAFRPQFDGPVQQGRRYIFIDDVFTMGGSLNELRIHIQKQGASVVQTAALATSGHGPRIALSPITQAALLDIHKENKVSSFLKKFNLYDGNYKQLTEPEALALRRAPSLNTARDRILKARRLGNASMGIESPCEREASPLNQTRHHRKR